jgi:diguanylate cyclase (GGDEF)-like protein
MAEHADAPSDPGRAGGAVNDAVIDIDEITGLPGRSAVIDRLGAALIHAGRYRSPVAFLVLGVDRLASISRSQGYEVADEITAGIAARIRRNLRGGDAVARFAGDEFALILMDCDEERMAIAAARFISAIAAEPIATRNGAIGVAVAIGGVVLPRHARSVRGAIAAAEEALHAARHLPKPPHFAAHIHSSEDEERRRREAELSSDIVHALNQRRLRLAYQPVTPTGDAPLFHEALLRLERADRTITPASEFIGLSESIGILRLLDHRALEMVLEDLRERPDLRLSVNLSPETAAEPSWMGYLTAALRTEPSVAGRLTVEITESRAIGSLEEAGRFVAQLRDLGCIVAIDDFGSGYTSFRNLRALKVDLVKIDGSYVENLAASREDQAFVRTLVDLAGSLGMKTVAEWVEDEHAAAMLRAWGVDYLQGNFIGAPTLDLPER